MVKEREAGTIEQLLMSPAGTYEIIIAKIVPLFLLLFLMVLFATGFIKLVFDVPFQGSILVLFCRAQRCVCSRHRHRNGDRDIHALGISGAAHQLFRESAADHRFRRDHAAPKRYRHGCGRSRRSTRSTISA